MLIKQTEPPICCAFCGWPETEETKPKRELIYSDRCCICSKCIGVCHNILFESGLMLAGDIEYFSWFAIPHDHFPTEISEQSTNLWLSERTNRAEILDAEITRLRARVDRMEANDAFDLMIEIIGELNWWRNRSASDAETLWHEKQTNALMEQVRALRTARTAMEEKDA